MLLLVIREGGKVIMLGRQNVVVLIKSKLLLLCLSFFDFMTFYEIDNDNDKDMKKLFLLTSVVKGLNSCSC